MKTNTILIGGFGALVASAGVAFGLYQNCNQGPEHYQAYQPTDVEQVVDIKEEEEGAKSAHGAARYYNLLRADPSTGTFSAADVKRAYDQAEKISGRSKVPASKIGWKSIGPDNVGGRTRAIVIDNEDNSVVFAGSVSGGLYKSTNKGNTWESISYERSGRYKSLAISCMEQTSEGTIYFGTGERGFTSFGGLGRANTRSGFKGMGIWKSEDRGETWTHLESTIPDQPYGASRSTWSSVNELAIDPTNPQHILAATMNGVMETKDGGESWNKIPGLLPNTYLEVEFADDGQTVFVASQGSLYRSSDGAQSFNRVTGSGFPQSDVGRIELDLAPTDNSVVYASVAKSSRGLPRAEQEIVEGIYKSVDKGQTWNVIAEGGRSSLFDPFRNSIRGQGQYDNVIAVSPVDKHRIFLAGVHFWTYKGDGNFNGQWKKVANSTPFFGSDDQFKDPQYLHVDHHEIRFDTESDPPIMYMGNDGGVFKTSNDFRNRTTPDYKEINTGYTTTQFYAFDVAKNGDVLGGTQDNGTFKYLKDGLTGRSYREVLGGDGFYSAISKLRPNVYISETYNGRISRSSDRGGSYNRVSLNVSGDALFNTPFQMFEKRNDPLSKDSIVYGARTELALKANETITPDGSKVDLYRADSKLEQTQENTFQAKVDLARLPGDSVEITSSSGVNFKVRIDSSLQPEEDIKVQDPVRALFAVGLRNNIWITPGMLNFNQDPKWYRVANINLNTPSSLRFSDDGKSLLVAGRNGRDGGRVFRIDGIRKARYDDPDNFDTSNKLSVQRIGNFNGIVTSATFDQNNKNKMVVTTGNYGVDNHVYYTDSAMSNDPNYTELDGSGQNSLPEMPVYDGMFKLDSTTQIVIGAEMGTWTYDLATPTQGWQEINNGMPRVPVYMLRQLRKGDEYKAYAATFGRGIFSTTQEWSSTEDAVTSSEDSYEPSIKAYPNPASNYTNLQVDLEKGSQGQLEMVNMQGKVIKRKRLSGTRGDQEIRMSTANLKTGTYIVRIRGEGVNKSTKVVVQ